MLDFGWDDGTREAHIRRSGPCMQSELIRIVDLAQRGETETLAIDAKCLAAKSSVAGKAKRSRSVRRGGCGLQLDTDIRSQRGIAITHDPAVDVDGSHAHIGRVAAVPEQPVRGTILVFFQQHLRLDQFDCGNDRWARE